MAGEVLVVGNAKASVVVAKIALRVERKKAREKKLVEAAARKKLQKSHLTEEKNKRNVREIEGHNFLFFELLSLC